MNQISAQNFYKGEDYYKDIADKYAKAKNLKHRQYFEKPNYLKLLDEADVAEKDVIDLACGSGFCTRLLREKVNPNHEVWGIDISENMVQLAKSQSTDSIKYMVKDCSEPLDLGKQFDAVSCTYLLQHAKNYDMLKQFLSNIFNMLKPGGIVFGMNGGVRYDDLCPKLITIYQTIEGKVKCEVQEQRVPEFNQVWFRETDDTTGLDSTIPFFFIKGQTYERAFQEVGFTDVKIYSC